MSISLKARIYVYWSKLPLWVRLVLPTSILGALIIAMFAQYAYLSYRQPLVMQLAEEVADIKKVMSSAVSAVDTAHRVLAKLPQAQQPYKQNTDSERSIWENIVSVLPSASIIQLAGPDKSIIFTASSPDITLPDLPQLQSRWQTSSKSEQPGTPTWFIFVQNGESDSMLVLAEPVAVGGETVSYIVTYLSLKAILDRLDFSSDNFSGRYALTHADQVLACITTEKHNWQGERGDCLNEAEAQEKIVLLPEAPTLSRLSVSASLSDRQETYVMQHALTDTLVVALGVMLLVVVMTRIIYSGITGIRQRTEQMILSNMALSQTVNELERTREEVVNASKLSSLGLIVAGVAHELNTPMAGAKLAISNIDSKSTSDDIRQGLAMTKKYLERMNKLVKRFKSIAIERNDTNATEVELHAMLDEQINTLWLRHQHSPHRIENNVAEGTAVMTQKGALSQVLDNLVDNAITHAFGPADHGIVEITAEITNHHCILRVNDNGKGIDKKLLPSIFRPFVTTARGSGGTGLGLYICQQLVEKKLHGQLLASSSNDQGGTSFEIYLPLKPPKE